MAKSFQELVGIIIHNCGSLELFINNAIKMLVKDELLAREAANPGLERRIKLLTNLLEDRRRMTQSDSTALQQRLLTLADHRNKVAYDPIAALKSKNNRELCILVPDRKNDPGRNTTTSSESAGKLGKADQ